jgi:predicted nucleotidyltransferase
VTAFDQSGLSYNGNGTVVSIPEELRERLLGVLRSGPPLRLAVLFGSRATGRQHLESDFDVGIVPVDPGLTLHQELDLASALSGALGAEVDVVRLDEAPPLVGAEVARDGVCLLEATPGDFAAYRADAVSLWVDFDETIAPFRARLLRRLSGAVQ